MNSRMRSFVGVGLFLVTLALWIGWLRAPSLSITLWNVDESIHAAAARTLLEGGVMYRDAVDQRTPLTYYVFAVIFKVCGVNNLVAVRVVITGMIIATAFGLFLIGRRVQSRATGISAAFIFAAFSSHLLYSQDTYAAHTEWFVALFSTGAAVTFFLGGRIPTFRRSLVIGAFGALALLSKQPGLTDIGAPVATLFYLGLLRSRPWREIGRSFGGIAIGFCAVVLPAVCLLVAAGAGKDALFYTWTYNIKFYGPEIGWGERLLSISPLTTALAQFYPVLLVVVVGSFLGMAISVAQLKYSETEYERRRVHCYLLVWFVVSLVGALSSGRGYSHYFFQCLPPIAWLAGSAAGWLWQLIAVPGNLLRRSLAAIGLSLVVVSAVRVPLAARKITPPPLDPALPIAAFIREHSTSKDKIFVWGYNPDIYMYANRAPASRFFYCSFQTGLIPWTNEAPGIDTRYAIVPGSMETLLSDLARNQPAFIVDCGVGPHRRFSKYPVQNFTDIYSYIEAHYVEVEPAIFLGRGFRVFMRRSSTAAKPSVETGSGNHPAPTIGGPTSGNQFVVAVSSETPSLQRLSVQLDGAEFAAVQFPPAKSLKFQVKAPATSVGTSLTLRSVAEWTDGTRTTSAPLTSPSSPLSATSTQRTEFALPRVAGSIPADGVRALVAPNATTENGVRSFNLHAPSILSYPLPANAITVRGRFGIHAGAYSSDNANPTDGAVFTIKAIPANGQSRIIYEKWLRPAILPADRPTQSFEAAIGKVLPGDSLQFEISPGPDGSMSSDWTYWTDLTLEQTP